MSTINLLKLGYLLGLAQTIRLEPDRIVWIVARYYGFQAHELQPDDLARRVAQARQMAMYCLRKYSTLRPAQIAAMFGRCRESVYVAWNSYHNNPDPEVRRELQEVSDLLKAEAMIRYNAEITF